jgi:hypothetical protein
MSFKRSAFAPQESFHGERLMPPISQKITPALSAPYDGWKNWCDIEISK